MICCVSLTKPDLFKQMEIYILNFLKNGLARSDNVFASRITPACIRLIWDSAGPTVPHSGFDPEFKSRK